MECSSNLAKTASNYELSANTDTLDQTRWRFGSHPKMNDISLELMFEDHRHHPRSRGSSPPFSCACGPSHPHAQFFQTSSSSHELEVILMQVGDKDTFQDNAGLRINRDRRLRSVIRRSRQNRREIGKLVGAELDQVL